MLSERLKSLRLESKITQKEISDKLEIGQGTYARYEKGDRKPTGEILNKLANFFNVSTDYLLGNTDNKNSTKFEDDLEESLNTARAFSGKPISEHDREVMREILTEMFKDK
ncbi:XRE family transcriptional regulator [Lactococcus raffinolactis]|uniref:helix-turn-helix domain-containing protein n=1 Tax=Pseudolactococcus raffinolactis TaxID=1366 RepID=UPI001C705F34|nr:helix-turn-helix transcriptional regulator [Lactococcus raffinolactis]MBW9330946.1 XRE family transcriptional regulator [Lactococcus raffinolactis]